MTLGGTRLNPPEDDTEFERICVPLWRGILKDPNVKRVGRNGQAQHGVDLVGTRNGNPNTVVGIQCKWKGLGKKLDPQKDVRNEIVKAKQFSPSLREYHIVTTADDSTDMDQLALTISQELANEGIRMTFHIWGWGHLSQEIQQYPEALKALDQSYSPHADSILRDQAEHIEISRTTRDEVRTLTAKISAMQADYALGVPSDQTSSMDAVLHVLDGEIDAARDLLHSGDPQVALISLRRVESRLPVSGLERIRFRIKANIGLCYHDLDDDVAACIAFEEAYAALPNDPKAIAFRAFGLLLSKEWTTLQLFAQHHLASDPSNLQLAGYYVQGAQFDDSVQDLLLLVPEELRMAPEIRVAVAHTMQIKRDSGWRVLAREVLAASPDDPDAIRLAADADFEDVLESGLIGGGRILTAVQVEKLEQACSGYANLWERLADRTSGSSTLHSSLAANYINVLRLLEKPTEALRVGRTAVEIFSNDEPLQIRIAAAAAEAGEWALFDTVSSKLPDCPDTTMLRFDAALQQQHWNELVALSDNDDFAAIPSGDRDLVDCALALARHVTGENRHDADVLMALAVDFSSSLRGSVILSGYAHEHGFDGVSDAAYENALSVGKLSKLPSDRMTLAHYAESRKDWNTIIDMLDGLIPEHRPSPLLSMLACAHANADVIRERSEAFFERLPRIVAQKRFFLFAYGSFQSRIGRIEPAKALLAEAFGKKAGLDILLPMVQAMWQLGEQQDVKTLVATLDVDSLPGSPLQRMDFAHLLTMLGRPAEGYRIGYETLVDTHDDADVVLKYTGLFLPSALLGAPEDHIMRFDQVERGAWISLSNDDEKELEGIVGGSGPLPWGERLEPDHELVRKAHGLTEGGCFTHHDPVLGETVWTVAEIKDPRLQAFQFFMSNFNTRFPTASGLGSLRIVNDDIKPILDWIERSGRRDERQCQLYNSLAMPLGLFGLSHRGGTIGFASAVASHGFRVKTCRGFEGERTEALGTIHDYRGRGAVLDLITVWTAVEMRILDVLKAVFGTLIIPFSVWRDLKALEEERSSFGSGEAMSVGWRRGQHIRDVRSPAEQAEIKHTLSKMISDIERNCEIRSVTIPDEPGEVADALLDTISDLLDVVYLAGSDHVILSDDLHYREVASVVTSSRGVWLQAVLLYAVDEKMLSRKRFHDALMGLAYRRHGHLAVSAADLRHALVEDLTPDLSVFSRMADFIGGPSADLRSNADVAAGFLGSIWARRQSHPPALWRRSRGTMIVLAAILKGRSGAELALWHKNLCTRVSDRLNRVIERYCRKKIEPKSLRQGYEELRSYSKSSKKGFKAAKQFFMGSSSLNR